MAPHARLIAVSLAGLLALSLAPTTFGQAASPVLEVSSSVGSARADGLNSSTSVGGASIGVVAHASGGTNWTTRSAPSAF